MASSTPQNGQSCRASQITRDPRCATLLLNPNFDCFFFVLFTGQVLDYRISVFAGLQGGSLRGSQSRPATRSDMQNPTTTRYQNQVTDIFGSVQMLIRASEAGLRAPTLNQVLCPVTADKSPRRHPKAATIGPTQNPIRPQKRGVTHHDCRL